MVNDVNETDLTEQEGCLVGTKELETPRQELHQLSIGMDPIKIRLTTPGEWIFFIYNFDWSVGQALFVTIFF